MITILFSALILFILGVFAYVHTPKFGALPKGERLEKIKKSKNFSEGVFKNINTTPNITEGYSFPQMMKEYLFKPKKNIFPQEAHPALKTDLINLPENENVLVWFGHSSYFMQLNGKRILVDPVFSLSASPIPFTTRAFKGTSLYTPEDMPAIDYLFISHDHWDHLDYPTVMKLKTKIGKIITGLGTGAHFERWGFEKDKIIELDWEESTALGEGFTVYGLPARHFSGRSLTPNKSLWMSFVLKTPDFKIYIGGDSGYDTFYTDIGKKFNGIDLAVLECGQYDKAWKYIHMQPEEVIKASQELKAKHLLPVHNSKFSISNHPWKEPLERISKLGKEHNYSVLTPVIGQKIDLNLKNPETIEWWATME